MKEKGYSLTANINCLIISLVFLCALTLMALYMPELKDFDVNALKNIQAFLSQFPSQYPILIANFGLQFPVIWPQIAICSVLIADRQYVKAFLTVFFTQATFSTTILIKNFVGRERPPLGAEVMGFSFPSMHSSMAMCVYGIVVYLILTYTRNKFWRYFLATFFSLYILLVAISRLWLGVHFLTDVIGGLFLGLIFVNLYIIICKACKF